MSYLARLLVPGFAAIALAAPGEHAIAQAISSATGEMVFRVVAPCSGSASYCGSRILGIGEITPRTPRRFDEFVAAARAAEELPPTPSVSLHSPGGSLAAGVALGQAIRRNGFDTLLQPSYEMVPTGSLREETIVPVSVCASACAFAFIGGVNREVWKGSRLGVHQFYSEGTSGGEAVSQLLQVLLSTYVQSMGVDRKLVDLASVTPPSSMYWLREAELKDLRIVTDALPQTPWTITANISGVPTLQVEQPISAERSLSVRIRRSGSVLAMRISLRFERAKTNQARLQFFMENQGPKVSLEFGADSVEAAPVDPWRRRDAADAVFFERTFLLPVTAGAAISQARTVRIADDLHPAYRDLSLTTRLAILGLREGTALLLRVDAR